MKKYSNILVVRTDRIGDVVLTTPAIAALKRAMPESRLTVLVSPLTKDLLQGNPYIDEVIVDDRSLGFWKLVKNLKVHKFDLAIIYHTKKRTNSMCFFAGIPDRLGYANDKFGFLLTLKVKDARPQGLKHESKYCVDLLKTIGIDGGSHDVFIPLQPEAEQWAADIFANYEVRQNRAVFAIHPGASCPTKKWPVSKFAQLIRALKEKYGCYFIVIGAQDNRITADALIKESQVPVMDMTGKTSIAQLVSLLKRCDLLVSNDSGPVHMADGIGTPVVSIFTRNQPGINPERWRPLRARSRYVAPPVNMSYSFAKGVVEDPQFLEMINVQTVLESVDAIFKLC